MFGYYEEERLEIFTVKVSFHLPGEKSFRGPPDFEEIQEKPSIVITHPFNEIQVGNLNSSMDVDYH